MVVSLAAVPLPDPADVWRISRRFTRRGSASSTSNSTPAAVAYDLAARRHAVEEREDQPAKRVDILAPIGFEKLEAQMLLQILDLDPAIGFEGAVRAFGQAGRQDLVMLVLNLADDLLHQILDRGHAVRAAIFVDHDGHMGAGIAHLHQEIEDLHRRRHEQKFAQDGLQLEMLAVAPERQKILEMHHAGDVVERVAHRPACACGCSRASP